MSFVAAHEWIALLVHIRADQLRVRRRRARCVRHFGGMRTGFGNDRTNVARRHSRARMRNERFEMRHELRHGGRQSVRLERHRTDLRLRPGTMRLPPLLAFDPGSRCLLALPKVDRCRRGVSDAAPARRNGMHDRGPSVRLQPMLHGPVARPPVGVHWRRMEVVRRHRMLVRRAEVSVIGRVDSRILPVQSSYVSFTAIVPRRPRSRRSSRANGRASASSSFGRSLT